MLNDGNPVPVYLETTETSLKSHWTMKNHAPIPKAIVNQVENGIETLTGSLSFVLSILIMIATLSMKQIIPTTKMAIFVPADVHQGFSETKAILITN